MPFYERAHAQGTVRIHYEERGSGFPLLLIPGGGLNANMSAWSSPYGPFDAMSIFSDEFRCATADLRNAAGGQSTGPLEIDRPWDSYADDQLGLMDHLGCDRFLVLGCCIGGPFNWNLIQRAPDRVAGAVMCQPSGYSADHPTIFYDNNTKNWAPKLIERNPDVTADDVDAFLNTMYTNRADFVFTVTRDFVRACETPVLVMPDDVPPHPFAVAVESASLAPNAEMTRFPWKDNDEHLKEALGHVREFLRRNAKL